MEQRISRMQQLIRAIREIRNRYQVDARTPLSVSVRCSEDLATESRSLNPFIASLASVGRLECGPQISKPHQSAGHVAPEFEAYVSLQGLIDVPAEIKRMEKQRAEKQKALAAAQAKLDNPNFVQKAAPEVVEQERERLKDLRNQLEVIEANLHDLQQG
jgi:valyl-tRNA synthetase